MLRAKTNGELRLTLCWSRRCPLWRSQRPLPAVVWVVQATVVSDGGAARLNFTVSLTIQ